MNKSFISIFFASFLALISGFFVGIYYLGFDKSTIVFAQEKGDAVQSFQDSFRNVSKKILPSTVEIYATGIVKTRDPFRFLFFFDMPGLNVERQTEWIGSGVIIGKDSKKSNLFYVLTNSHVVDNTIEFEIRTYDKKSYKAKLIGKDDKKDIALISFESGDANIEIAELGDSDKLEVGDWVIAVGSPHSFSFSVTAGIISGLHRSANPNLKARNLFIQTDAAINRGNSGGPLVNIKGEVIGINTWIFSSNIGGGNVGLGFAIPINDAKSIFNILMSGKQNESAWMGVAFYNIRGRDSEIIKSLGYEDGFSSVAVISGIYYGMAAFKAGLRAGDIVSKINGVPMDFYYDVIRYISDFYAKEKIKVEILRGKEKKNVEIELDVKPKINNNKEYISTLRLVPGFTVYPLTKEVKTQLGLRNWINGVVVDSVDSSLGDNPKILTGDIVMVVNSKSIKNLRDFYDAIEFKKNSYSILRDGKTIEVSF
ncbi:trypsin-like peptidase domain-containing protein [Borrelia anserina]|uniref:Endopeptidase degP n=2 Tax=Borrelia anserina TaxID=143 RepID=W5SSQ2_BORAN|nr:trypsin-like peptidase domain-containing protein [Borrelia anserina]AHH08066.1 Endopeptidase degP [Borrelia anserina BA2]AHH08927.1 Endopeptidase degP [Borrelia anserina BA2]APR64612.1 serine protease [Borrelia anserina Es]UPA06526.1 trypsin-like peptidase domain-containing protein [Borrelia anserina]